MRGHGVDDDILDGDVGIIGSNVAGHRQKEAVGHLQHIGLVDHGHLLATAHGEIEGGPRNAIGAGTRDLAHAQGDVLRRHELAGSLEHVAVRVEAFRVLTGDDQVHAGNHRGHARTRPARVHVGVEVEGLAQAAGGIDSTVFGRRIAESVDRPEDDPVRRPRRLDHGLGQGTVATVQRREADVAVFQIKFETEPAVEHLEGGHRRRHDFRPDAVTRQNKQLQFDPPLSPIM